jgi:hypothetical protein
MSSMWGKSRMHDQGQRGGTGDRCNETATLCAVSGKCTRSVQIRGPILRMAEAAQTPSR